MPHRAILGKLPAVESSPHTTFLEQAVSQLISNNPGFLLMRQVHPPASVLQMSGSEGKEHPDTVYLAGDDDISSPAAVVLSAAKPIDQLLSPELIREGEEDAYGVRLYSTRRGQSYISIANIVHLDNASFVYPGQLHNVDPGNPATESEQQNRAMTAMHEDIAALDGRELVLGSEIDIAALERNLVLIGL